MGATGAWLMWSSTPWYAGHSLADQRDAGVLMLVGGGLALSATTVAVAWAAILREHAARSPTSRRWPGEAPPSPAAARGRRPGRLLRRLVAWSGAAGGQSRPSSPAPDARALLARGRTLFAQGCASCHGEDRAGDRGRGRRCAAPARRQPTSTCRPAACRWPIPTDEPVRTRPPLPARRHRRPRRLRRLASAGRASRASTSRAEASPPGWRSSPSTAPGCHQIVGRGRHRHRRGRARRSTRRPRRRSPRPCASGPT